MMLNDFLERGAYVVAYIHEGMHWLMARALGLKAKVVIKPAKRQAYCRVGTYYDWQDILVALAPALLTIPLLLLGQWMVAIPWTIGCVFDFKHVADILTSAIRR